MASDSDLGGFRWVPKAEEPGSFCLQASWPSCIWLRAFTPGALTPSRRARLVAGSRSPHCFTQGSRLSPEGHLATGGGASFGGAPFLGLLEWVRCPKHR